MSRDDDSLFEEAMRQLELPQGLDEHGDPGLGESALRSRLGVLSTRVEATSSSPEDALQHDDDLFLETMQSIDFDVAESTTIVETARRAAPSRASLVRKGTMQADVILDLHGYTRDEALPAIERAISKAQSSRRPCKTGSEGLSAQR